MTTTTEPCLHCREGKNKVQVSCDACQAYICVDCHWCHEFQANHEIRVCDRCDSFLCKECEDMEQCHDCGEVVCKSCGNLLTCKFCGSSLCEECATACAKCGIVLCGRDAKFAVDCDTCKLSYCLVCLASGQKESCIRCHARPSKRMEQLVHLRLKSIYKAFQQSARTNDAHPHLKRAALAAMKNSKEPKVDPIVAKAQADAAAAELLAELEEEESKAVQSKSKKKRKKKKKGGTGDDHVDDGEQKNAKESEMRVEAKVVSDHESRTESRQNLLPDIAVAAVAKEDSYIPESSIAKEQVDYKYEQEGEEEPEIIELVHRGSTAKKPSPVELKLETQTDEMHNELYQLVNAEDVSGIEDLLDKWKGVPGMAALRKNAKKALKRLSNSSPDHKPRLRIVSTTAKSPTTFETIIEMDAAIVGYIIGKNGQAICDLMDVSGARIWIDQDSMKANEPRVVYVNGLKKAVNVAVKRIKDIVKETETVKSADTETADLLEEVQAVSRPVDESFPSHWIREEIKCESRFVRLLIGRRGWNIKRIQDQSGAKVDIDQSVTPRIIFLTGPPSSVETAKRLVSDVLRSPHAQLKTECDVDEGDLVTREDAHTPPPSSYVMTGDIKSVSASSSLSSTPEPSMASSKGREFVTFPPGLFDNTNRGSEVPRAQQYSQPVSYTGEPFGQQQPHAYPYMQHHQNLRQPMPPLPPHHTSQGLAGTVPQQQQQMCGPAPPMMGQMPGMPHQHMQQHMLPMNQQSMLGVMHINPDILSQHQLAMQHQQMAMAQQQGVFLHHGNPNEAMMRNGPRMRGMTMGPQMPQNSTVEGQDRPAALFGGPIENPGPGLIQSQMHEFLRPAVFHPSPHQNESEMHRKPPVEKPHNIGGLLHPSFRSCDPIKDILPRGIPVKSGNPLEESNLVDSLFAPSIAGAEPSSLLPDINGLNVNDISWKGASKSRLPLTQPNQRESRFEWGS